MFSLGVLGGACLSSKRHPRSVRIVALVRREWERLLAEASRLHLPTVFLQEIPPGFIRFEFDDLRTYAAEYHPDKHRLVLNRSLSLDAAGGDAQIAREDDAQGTGSALS